MKNRDIREQVAEEIATKLYDIDVKDVRQSIDVIKLYQIQKSKTVDQIFEFREAYSQLAKRTEDQRDFIQIEYA